MLYKTEQGYYTYFDGATKFTFITHDLGRKSTESMYINCIKFYGLYITLTQDNTNHHDHSDTSRYFFFASVPMSTTLNLNHTVWTVIQAGRYHDAIL